MSFERSAARDWLTTPSDDLQQVANFAGYEIETVLKAARTLRARGWSNVEKRC